MLLQLSHISGVCNKLKVESLHAISLLSNISPSLHPYEMFCITLRQDVPDFQYYEGERRQS